MERYFLIGLGFLLFALGIKFYLGMKRQNKELSDLYENLINSEEFKVKGQFD